MLNRLTTDSTGSTSSIGTGVALSVRNPKSPRRVQSLWFCSSTVRVYDLKMS